MSECKRYTSDEMIQIASVLEEDYLKKHDVVITDKYGNYRTYSTVKMAAMLRRAAGNFKASERRK